MGDLHGGSVARSRSPVAARQSPKTVRARRPGAMCSTWKCRGGTRWRLLGGITAEERPCGSSPRLCPLKARQDPFWVGSPARQDAPTPRTMTPGHPRRPLAPSVRYDPPPGRRGGRYLAGHCFPGAVLSRSGCPARLRSVSAQTSASAAQLSRIATRSPTLQACSACCSNP